MNLAFSIVLLFTLLDCVTNESSLALKGCHVPLTAFYRAVKALLILFPKKQAKNKINWFPKGSIISNSAFH